MGRALCILQAQLIAVVLSAAPLQAAECVTSLSQYTATVPSLSTFTTFVTAFETAGFNPKPSIGYAVFAPNNRAWSRLAKIIGTGVGNSASTDPTNIAASPAVLGPSSSSSGSDKALADVLLSIGLYHYTLDNKTTPQQYLAAGTAQTALGDIIQRNVSLYFTEVDSKIQVEGIPFGNSAALGTPDKVCTTVVYEIDEAMIPANSISDIPPFSQIISAEAPGTGQALPPPNGIFDLPVPPNTDSISLTVTGDQGPAPSTAANSTTDINGNRAAGTQQNSEAPPPGSVSVNATTPPPTSAARRTQPLRRWQTGTLMAAVAAIGLAAWQ